MELSIPTRYVLPYITGIFVHGPKEFKTEYASSLNKQIFLSFDKIRDEFVNELPGFRFHI